MMHGVALLPGDGGGPKVAEARTALDVGEAIAARVAG